jgi:hypothetical protein
MPLTVAKPRSLWEDRFGRPTIDDLLDGCPRSVLSVIEHARAKLSHVKNVSEQLAWQGIPWRWTLTYTHLDDTERAFAYLVPDPAKPRLVVPFPIRVLSEIPLKKFSKVTREGLTHATVVGSVSWCQWEIVTKAGTDEIIALADLKIATLAIAGK